MKPGLWEARRGAETPLRPHRAGAVPREWGAEETVPSCTPVSSCRDRRPGCRLRASACSSRGTRVWGDRRNGGSGFPVSEPPRGLPLRVPTPDEPKVKEEGGGRAGQLHCLAHIRRAKHSPETVVRVTRLATLSGRLGQCAGAVASELRPNTWEGARRLGQTAAGGSGTWGPLWAGLLGWKLRGAQAEAPGPGQGQRPGSEGHHLLWACPALGQEYRAPLWCFKESVLNPGLWSRCTAHCHRSDFLSLRSESTGGEHLAPGGTAWQPSESPG